MPSPLSRRAFVAASITLAACRPKVVPLRVAAAADLGPAFGRVGPEFTRATGRQVSFTFGSTGLLARQIAEGAPFDVFAAASVTHIDQLVAKGALDGATRAVYARGRLAVWTRNGMTELVGLAQLVAPHIARIAIANPEHAPYGQAAMEALRRAGVLDAIRPRLVYGENVQQAMQYVSSGNADAGVLALSVVLGAAGRHVIVDASLHDPIDQAIAVCTATGDPVGARAFTELVRTTAAPILRESGFTLPGER